MPTMNDVAPSEWIKANQFKSNEQKTLTIKSWETSVYKDQKSGKEKTSLTLCFEETKSKLGIVNVANETALNKIFGTAFDLDSLPGHQITLFTILVKQDDNGDPIMGIRIKAANGTVATAPLFPPPPAQNGEAITYWKAQGDLIKRALTEIAPFRGKPASFIANMLADWEAQGVSLRDKSGDELFDMLNRAVSTKTDAEAATK